MPTNTKSHYKTKEAIHSKIEFLSKLRSAFDFSLLDLYEEKLKDSTLRNDILTVLCEQLCILDLQVPEVDEESEVEEKIEADSVSDEISEEVTVDNSVLITKVYKIITFYLTGEATEKSEAKRLKISEERRIVHTNYSPEMFFKITRSIFAQRTSSIQFILFEYYASRDIDDKRKILNIILSSVNNNEHFSYGLFAGFISRNILIEKDFGMEFINKCIKTYARVILNNFNGFNFSYYMYMMIYFYKTYRFDESDQEIFNTTKVLQEKTGIFRVSEGILGQFNKISGREMVFKYIEDPEIHFYYVFDEPENTEIFSRVRGYYREYNR